MQCDIWQPTVVADGPGSYALAPVCVVEKGGMTPFDASVCLAKMDSKRFGSLYKTWKASKPSSFIWPTLRRKLTKMLL